MKSGAQNPILTALSSVNLILTVLSLSLHLPTSRLFTSFPTTNSSLLQHLAFVSPTATWLIPALGLLVAFAELIIQAKFHPNRLGLCTVAVAGWGMIMKTRGLDVQHLIISSCLAGIAGVNLWMNLQKSRKIPQENEAEVPTKLPKSTNRIVNPSLGMNLKIGSKPPDKRRTIAVGNPATRRDFCGLPAIQEAATVMDDFPLRYPVKEMFGNFARGTSEKLKNVFPDMMEPEVEAGPRKNSATLQSKAFQDLIRDVLPKSSCLSSLQEEQDQSDNSINLTPSKPSRKSISRRIVDTPVDMIRRMGVTEIAARLLGGLFLGFIVFIGTVGLILLIDIFVSLPPTSFLKDLARLFRENIAAVRKSLAVDEL